MQRRSRSLATRLAVALAASLLLVGPSVAQEGTAAATAGEEECTGWLPDFKCGRSGRFEGFEKPIVAPYLFEDPFITTSLTPYYLYHEYPGRSALQGGDLQVVALQARLALTDRLAVIATKDGYGWNSPDNPLLDDRNGWFNIAAGLKYAFLQDREEGYIMSGVLRFEIPLGASDVFQGDGSGMVLPSITGAYDFGRVNFLADFGAQIPFDGDQSTSLFYHLYADVEVAPMFQPFVQISGLTWVSSGDGSSEIRLANGARLPLSVVQTALNTGPFEGADVANLGSEDVSGLDLWTWAVGTHIPITEHVTFSVAYERPFSHHKGIFLQRVTTALQLEF